MIQKPVITAAEAAAKVRDGDVLMVGGFMACGSPHTIIEALVERGARDMTLVCNDTATHDLKSGKVNGVGRMVQKRQFKKIIASHIGLNQETQRQMNAGETEVALVPQGTLAERVRAGGVGLGGVLTPTGLGTEVEEGKQVITVGDRRFLLELPLKGDVAVIKAKKADRAGNLVYAATAQNFNPLMAMAASTVIAEAEEIVEVGEIDPNAVHTASIFVDFLVKSERLEG
ncbi:MAG: CoA transferase subunit A [Acidobacteria bacterium]|nr:CoA transferase subunit A [Acidobacteriota bacterium]MBI3486792.1 CoA transferase subunit A [Acidobacteriota bacterium]